jgi:hypothetical protein
MRDDDDTERACWEEGYGAAAAVSWGSLMLEIELERFNTEFGCGIAELKFKPPRV